MEYIPVCIHTNGIVIISSSLAANARARVRLTKIIFPASRKARYADISMRPAISIYKKNTPMHPLSVLEPTLDKALPTKRMLALRDIA